MKHSSSAWNTRLELSAEGLTILVVDVNALADDGIACYLRQSGHHIQVALDGKSALETAQASQPDVAVLDDRLPDMSGNQVAEGLAKQGRWKRPFLILLGADQSSPDASHAGIDLRVVKPMDLDWLRMLLGRLEAIIKPAGDMRGQQVVRIGPRFAPCQ